MNKEHILQAYYNSCDSILRLFICLYLFEDEEDSLNDFYYGIGENWIAGEIGGVACINDYYISMDDMVFCLDNSVNRDLYFAWYDYTMDEAIQDHKYINLRHYFNLHKDLFTTKP